MILRFWGTHFSSHLWSSIELSTCKQLTWGWRNSLHRWQKGFNKNANGPNMVVTMWIRFPLATWTCKNLRQLPVLRHRNNDGNKTYGRPILVIQMGMSKARYIGIHWLYTWNPSGQPQNLFCWISNSWVFTTSSPTWLLHLIISSSALKRWKNIWVQPKNHIFHRLFRAHRVAPKHLQGLLKSTARRSHLAFLHPAQPLESSSRDVLCIYYSQKPGPGTQVVQSQCLRSVAGGFISKTIARYRYLHEAAARL